MWNYVLRNVINPEQCTFSHACLYLVEKEALKQDMAIEEDIFPSALLRQSQCSSPSMQVRDCGKWVNQEVRQCKFEVVMVVVVGGIEKRVGERGWITHVAPPWR